MSCYLNFIGRFLLLTEKGCNVGIARVLRCARMLSAELRSNTQKRGIEKAWTEVGSVLRLHGTAVDVCVKRKFTCMGLIPNFNVFCT